jgi:DNA invertase Pin-like site-specific DNA recombinase
MADLIGYIRVSSKGQADGYGPETQRQDIERWAAANGHQVVAWYEDLGVSGRSPLAERPGLMEAVEAILPPPAASGLVVARLDRLARTLTVQEAILATIWQGGGTVYSADAGEVMQDDPDDPMRTAVRQIVGVMAELDRALITKRLKAGRDAKKAKGERYTGRAPYGWRAANGKLEPIPDEQAALALMVRMRDAGASLPVICKALTDAGYLAKGGGSTWFPTTVSRYLNTHKATLTHKAILEKGSK